MRFLLRASALFLLVASICALSGCSKGPPVTLVEGRLLDNGSPYNVTPSAKLPPGEKGFSVIFVSEPASGPGEQFPATVKDDGTFRVPGNKNKGIPPGKYRIALHKGAFGSPDELKKAFTAEKSPLSVEIPAAKSVRVDADVGKKTATVVP